MHHTDADLEETNSAGLWISAEKVINVMVNHKSLRHIERQERISAPGARLKTHGDIRAASQSSEEYHQLSLS